jgi:hypothetical protein
MKKIQIDHRFYEQIQFDIDRVDKKADSYRVYYYALRIMLIVLASVITILSGMKGLCENFVLNSVLVLGAASTAATALDTLFQLETKKNTYRLMLVELREIRSEFIFCHEHRRAELDTLMKEKLFPKYQSIMAYSKSLLDKESESQELEKQS